MDDMVKGDKSIRHGKSDDLWNAERPVSGYRPHGGLSGSRAAYIVEAVQSVVKRAAKLHSPLIGKSESMAVKCAVQMGAVTHGPHVERFEQAIVGCTGAKYAVALSSGTAALHLSLLSVGIKPGDHVALPGFTFVAVANAVRYCGATPVFIDCDKYGSLSPVCLNDWLRHNHVEAVIAVHNFGHLCDIEEICKIGEKHSIPVIEDAAQALGAITKINGHTATISFNGNKTITTGGGGMVLTDDERTAERIRSLATVSKIEVPHSFWHSDVGFNYRMPNMNAALGLAQMDNLPDILERKSRINTAYHKAFEGTGYAAVLKTVRPTNHWLNAVVVRDEHLRHEVILLLNGVGIESRLSWTPLNLMPMYQNNPRDDLETTMRLANSIINVPSGPGICS
jgi:perosamine synthetase